MSVYACALRHGYSHGALMEALDCSSLTVSRWFKGYAPSMHNVRRLCSLFNVTETELLKEEPVPEPDMEELLAVVDAWGGDKGFCACTGLSYQTVQNWRCGTKAQPTTTKLVADMLHIPVEVFWR